MHDIHTKTFKNLNTNIITRLNIFFSYNIPLSAIVLPLAFVYGLHWTERCRPSLVGYFLSPSCISKCPSPSSVGLKALTQFINLVILLINHIILAYSIRYVAIMGSILLVLCTLSFEKNHRQVKIHKERLFSEHK